MALSTGKMNAITMLGAESLLGIITTNYCPRTKMWPRFVQLCLTSLRIGFFGTPKSGVQVRLAAGQAVVQ